MTHVTPHRRQRQLAFMLAITAAIIGAFWIGPGVEWAIPAAIAMLGFTAAFALGVNRSDAVEVVYGVGDERARHLHLRALAATALAMWAVIVGWYLVSVATGDPNETLGWLAAIFNVALISSAVVLSRVR